MANLALTCDQGHFETDPSTWVGYKITSNGLATLYRSNGYSVSGFNSGLILLQPVYGASAPYSFFYQKFNCQAGKKYVAKASFFTPNDGNTIQAADDSAVLTIELDSGPLIGQTIVLSSTGALAKVSFVNLETHFTASADGVCWVRIVSDINYHSVGSLVDGAYCDDFEIYEDTSVPPSCTLAIDTGSTVITDASGPSAHDGSITVATSGGTAPLQYSIDNGATWQSSDYFAGLPPLIYTLKVKDADDCMATLSFAINSAAAAFDFTAVGVNESISGAADGKITITVIGSGGPFTFSNDAGATYQSGNIFTGLAAGVYTIAVKDSSDNIVAHNVIIEAGLATFEDVFFSRNFIPFGASAETGFESLTNYRVYNDVRVQDVAASGIYNSKMPMALVPDANGQVVFQLRQAFRGVLQAIPPTLNESSIKQLTDRIKYFKNFTGALHDDLLVPASLTPSNPFLVLLGGIDKFHAPDLSFRSVSFQRFLTWAPTTKYIDSQQEDYLNFWVYDSNFTQIKLIVKAYYDDSSTAQHMVDSLSVQYGMLLQLPAGINTGVYAIDPTKNLLKYELWVTNQGDVSISEKRTFIIDQVSFPFKRFFMFLNSLGAYEVHRFYGFASSEVPATRTLLQKFLQSDYKATDGEFEVTNNSFQPKYVFSTGFFTDSFGDLWQEYMREILNTRKFFDVTTGKRKPMVITSASVPGKDDQTYQRFAQFEARDAYVDENFTPATA